MKNKPLAKKTFCGTESIQSLEKRVRERERCKSTGIDALIGQDATDWVNNIAERKNSFRSNRDTSKKQEKSVADGVMDEECDAIDQLTKLIAADRKVNPIKEEDLIKIIREL